MSWSHRAGQIRKMGARIINRHKLLRKKIIKGRLGAAGVMTLRRAEKYPDRQERCGRFHHRGAALVDRREASAGRAGRSGGRQNIATVH